MNNYGRRVRRQYKFGRQHGVVLTKADFAAAMSSIWGDPINDGPPRPASELDFTGLFSSFGVSKPVETTKEDYGK